MILRLSLYHTLIVIHCKKFLITTNICTLPIGNWDGWKYLVHLSDFMLLFERVPLIHNFFNLFFIFSDKKISGGGGRGTDTLPLEISYNSTLVCNIETFWCNFCYG